MSVVSRKLRATPVRSSSDTWKAIALLLAPDESSDAHVELMSVSGTAASLISSDAMRDAAVVCTGSGPRVRIYCLYGEDAITGDDANESPLQHRPTDEDWKVSLPCPTNDLDWVNRSLKKNSSRITARDMSERLGPTEEEKEKSSSASASVNTEAFLRS
jgi:hypothetical protein